MALSFLFLFLGATPPTFAFGCDFTLIERYSFLRTEAGAEGLLETSVRGLRSRRCPFRINQALRNGRWQGCNSPWASSQRLAAAGATKGYSPSRRLTPRREIDAGEQGDSGLSPSHRKNSSK